MIMQKANRVALKLGTAFMLLLAIVAAVGYFELNRMEDANRRVHDLFADDWKAMQLAQEAMQYSTQNSRLTMEVFLIDEDKMPEVLAQRAENTRRISQLIEQIEPLCDSDDEKAALEAVKTARGPYIGAYMGALHLLRGEHKPAQAREMMASDVTPALFRYHNAWNDFVRVEMRHIEAGVAENERTYALAHRWAARMLGLGLVVSAGIALFVTLRMTRELKTRLRIAAELHQLNTQLEDRVRERTRELSDAQWQLQLSLQEMREHAADIQRVNEFIELLQSCVALEEAFQHAAKVLPHFFPCGALLMINSSRNLLDCVAQWGGASVKAGPVPPDSCWALRRGRPHISQPGRFGLACTHLNEGAGANHFCVPMSSQGESLGVLYVQDPTPESATPLGERTQKYAVMIADEMSLAIGNLMLRETLRSQSVRDPLTGLFNRRYMEEAFERELLRAERTEKPVSVLMIDLDHFKQFNDSFGHDAGDLLLREIGSLFRSQIRGGDVACRYGGEEFLLILAETKLSVAVERAERLRQQVRDLQVRYRGQMLPKVSISVGIATCPDHASGVSQIMEAADRALYDAKRSGRDRVKVAAANDLQPAEATRS